jgi:hypothetical protein
MPKAKRVHSTPRRTASKTKPKSAITSVRGGKPATLDDYAKIDFKPWKNSPGMRKGELFPSNEFLANLGVSCRLAYAIMLRNRDELIASYGMVEERHADELMRNLFDTSEQLKAVREMVRSAYHRMLASGAAAHKQGVKFKGVDDKPARRKAVA